MLGEWCEWGDALVLGWVMLMMWCDAGWVMCCCDVGWVVNGMLHCWARDVSVVILRCWVNDVMWCLVSGVSGDTVVLDEWHDGVVLDEQFPILQRKVVPSSQGDQQFKKNDLDYLTLENESDTIFQSGTIHSTIQCHIWEEWNLPGLNYFFQENTAFFYYRKNTYAGWLQLSGTVWVRIFKFLDNLSVPTRLPSIQFTILVRYMNVALFGTG